MLKTGSISKGCLLLLAFGTAPAFGATTQTCPPDSHWVQAHHRRAYVKADGTFVSATNVTAHCQKNPPGYAFWKDRLKNGKPPTWPISGEAPSRWTAEEIERALEALSKLPEALLLSSVEGIYRMHKSVDFPNPATSTAGVIVLYDNAFDGKRNVSRILAHELAHEYYRQIPKMTARSYQTATNWFNVRDEGAPPFWISRRQEAFVENDGSISPAEDFANNVEYFLFDRTALKRITPNADGWIERHFGENFRLRRSDR